MANERAVVWHGERKGGAVLVAHPSVRGGARGPFRSRLSSAMMIKTGVGGPPRRRYASHVGDDVSRRWESLGTTRGRLTTAWSVLGVWVASGMGGGGQMGNSPPIETCPPVGASRRCFSGVARLGKRI